MTLSERRRTVEIPGSFRAFFFTSNRESLELIGKLWVTGGTPGDTFVLAEGLIFNPDVGPVWVPRLRLLFFVADDGEHGNPGS